MKPRIATIHSPAIGRYESILYTIAMFIAMDAENVTVIHSLARFLHPVVIIAYTILMGRWVPSNAVLFRCLPHKAP